MILPRPARLIQRAGRFVFDQDTAFRATPGAEPAARLLRRYLRPATGLPLPLSPTGTVLFALDDQLVGLGDEGYALTVGEQAVVLRARRLAGLRHGVQTIRQLLPAEALGDTPVSGVPWALPCVDVTDSPRLPWRGAMLDVARHFQPVRYLRRFVDLLALHKLSVLHLHLTDDQGWRMPVAAFPALTEIGGLRSETQLGPAGSDRFDGVPHGGAYTTAELRGLVDYAAERGVRVVPEIEMPGHARAALAAYPHLGSQPGRRLPVWTGWGISESVFGVTEETMEFCRTVLGEVMDVFPGEHVHIGGDEVPWTEWAASPAALARVAEEGLAGPQALRSWFLGRVGEFLLANGRVPVCWDGDGPPLDPRVVVMPWQDSADGPLARGHRVVLTPYRSTYLDYPQSTDARERPGQPGGVVTMSDVYHQRVPADPAVLGSQCQLWTEQAPRAEDVEYLAFPRLCALADALWSAVPDWTAFRAAMAAHEPRLAALSVAHTSLTTTS
ncbi:beta-N-acetylhexosaminidase [Actinophytocola algeriensis]|uniref:beta-N-acetylhexosaminidase n=1 Tax=Actinophytocola algeriensis TaxID=1768010 RepID=A0A7W7QDQ5_9PSEU|nr:beta-N-acetylhexosaminidase [Actinophytocola algeriensis]MBB4911747.1 hexosaminidase [Actinophytocola algeriensis]MBE1473265.1 hexosaminidase [Actinophytocola algeriensis]